jgi:hypothetical protein
MHIRHLELPALTSTTNLAIVMEVPARVLTRNAANSPIMDLIIPDAVLEQARLAVYLCVWTQRVAGITFMIPLLVMGDLSSSAMGRHAVKTKSASMQHV